MRVRKRVNEIERTRERKIYLNVKKESDGESKREEVREEKREKVEKKKRADSEGVMIGWVWLSVAKTKQMFWSKKR